MAAKKPTEKLHAYVIRNYQRLSRRQQLEFRMLIQQDATLVRELLFCLEGATHFLLLASVLCEHLQHRGGRQEDSQLNKRIRTLRKTLSQTQAAEALQPEYPFIDKEYIRQLERRDRQKAKELRVSIDPVLKEVLLETMKKSLRNVAEGANGVGLAQLLNGMAKK